MPCKSITRRTGVILLLSAFLFIAMLPAPVMACTVFASAEGDQVYAGNNEDWFDKDTFIWFIPAEKGKYGYAAYGFENAHPQGGMNEKGLFFDWFAQGGAIASPPAGKEEYQGNISIAILTDCASVQEVLSLYETWHDKNLGYATLLVADSTGDMASLTWDWQLNAMRVERPVGSSMSIGVGKDAIRGLLTEKTQANEGGFTAMAELASNENTLYSTICSLTKPSLTLYHLGDYQNAIHFPLSSELAKGRHMYSIPSLFPNGERSAHNEMTPESLRGKAVNTACIAILALLTVTALYCAGMLLRRKQPAALAAIGAAANMATLGTGIVVYHYAYFIANYGAGVLGLPVVLLAYASALLFAAQTVASIRAWAKAAGSLSFRMVLSLSSLLLFVILWYLSTIRMFS